MGSGTGVSCAVTLNTSLTPEQRARYQDVAQINHLLNTSKTIALVGLSSDRQKASYFVAGYLKDEGYRIVPVNPKADVILGEKVYPDVISIPLPRRYHRYFPATAGHRRDRDAGDCPQGKGDRLTRDLDAVASHQSSCRRAGASRGVDRHRRQMRKNGAWPLPGRASFRRDEYRDHLSQETRAVSHGAFGGSEADQFSQGMNSAALLDIGFSPGWMRT